MSPLKVLTRGYSVATTEDQQLINSVTNVSAGDHILLSVSDGQIGATVTYIKEDSHG
jgi:exodeoxyribonuclease VII large subunit